MSAPLKQLRELINKLFDPSKYLNERINYVSLFVVIIVHLVVLRFVCCSFLLLTILCQSLQLKSMYNLGSYGSVMVFLPSSFSLLFLLTCVGPFLDVSCYVQLFRLSFTIILHISMPVSILQYLTITDLIKLLNLRYFSVAPHFKIR